MKWPETEADTNALKATFMRPDGVTPWLLDCILAVDGTHIPIYWPEFAGYQYHCFKQFKALLAMAATDGRGLFRAFCVGFPGSWGDPRAYRESRISEYLARLARFGFAVGDLGTCGGRGAHATRMHWGRTCFALCSFPVVFINAESVPTCWRSYASAESIQQGKMRGVRCMFQLVAARRRFKVLGHELNTHGAS